MRPYEGLAVNCCFRDQTSLPPVPCEFKPETVALPPVKTILSALVWLAAKHRESPTRETRHAMASQARWLLMHPDARADDLISGFNLTVGACRHAAYDETLSPGCNTIDSCLCMVLMEVPKSG